MKNEILAQAMTHIDDALIAEADESPAKGSKVTSRSLMRSVYRWGSVAAVALIAVGLLLAGNLGGQDVLLYGESIADQPRTVNEYIPRSVAYVVDTIEIETINLPLELEFRKETKLTLTEGSMIVLDEQGNTVYEGRAYLASGKTSICLILPGDVDECIIEQSRGENIVLTRNTESGIWYVYIEK